MLAPALAAAAQDHGKIRIVFVFAGEFDGMDARAIGQDQTGIKDWGSWKRIALVTDHAWMQDGLRMFAWAVPETSECLRALNEATPSPRCRTLRFQADLMPPRHGSVMAPLPPPDQAAVSSTISPRRGSGAARPRLPSRRPRNPLGTVVRLRNRHVRKPGAEDEDSSDEHDPAIEEGIGVRRTSEQNHGEDAVGQGRHIDRHTGRSQVPPARGTPSAQTLAKSGQDNRLESDVDAQHRERGHLARESGRQ